MIPFFKYKIYFQGSFLPDDFLLDLKTLQHQQSQDPVLRNVYCKPITKTPFTLVWFSDDFCLIFTLQDFIGRMTKNQDRD